MNNNTEMQKIAHKTMAESFSEDFAFFVFLLRILANGIELVLYDR